MSGEDALKFAAEQGAEFVDVRFTDLLGQWHHLTIPMEEFGPENFESGVGFDASSLRGWAAINESDMILIPDAGRYWVDP
ncbi:MAG TPA: glutamine synthetase, partial [Blastocatellia bacterium]|nr:glutamine synthetase [Blastocatellia bacterium]